MAKIGIAGIGMVGGALNKYFDNAYLYDKYKEIGSLKELNKADFIYICVPTPTKSDGCDISAVEEVVKELTGKKIIIIKSTVEPGTTEKLQKKYPIHRFIHNPEFLTESTAEQDMKYPDMQIVGYTKESYEYAQTIMFQLPNAPFTKIVPSYISEFIKYALNSWFAVKVAKNNELYDIFKEFGGTDEEFKQITECLMADKRVGRGHLDIWHNGYRGYRGKCLPKDVEALIKFAEKLGEITPILSATKKYNEVFTHYRNGNDGQGRK